SVGFSSTTRPVPQPYLSSESAFTARASCAKLDRPGTRPVGTEREQPAGPARVQHRWRASAGRPPLVRRRQGDVLPSEAIMHQGEPGQREAPLVVGFPVLDQDIGKARVTRLPDTGPR